MCAGALRLADAHDELHARRAAQVVIARNQVGPLSGPDAQALRAVGGSDDLVPVTAQHVAQLERYGGLCGYDQDAGGHGSPFGLGGHPRPGFLLYPRCSRTPRTRPEGPLPTKGTGPHAPDASIIRPMKRAAAFVSLGLLAACSPTGAGVVPEAQMSIGVANDTSIAVELVVDGSHIRTIPPRTDVEVPAADLPTLPWEAVLTTTAPHAGLACRPFGRRVPKPGSPRRCWSARRPLVRATRHLFRAAHGGTHARSWCCGRLTEPSVPRIGQAD